MKKFDTRWRTTVGLCLPLLLLGSSGAFAGDRFTNCTDPNPPVDAEGNPTSDSSSTQGQFPNGDPFEVGWGLNADK